MRHLTRRLETRYRFRDEAEEGVKPIQCEATTQSDLTAVTRAGRSATREIAGDRHGLLSELPQLSLLDRDPFDFVERDFVAGSIIEFGRARTFMRRHRLSILQCAAVV